ncbi:MAG: purine-nucleoside phosphorylase [Solirubrobacterales bacterium]
MAKNDKKSKKKKDSKGASRSGQARDGDPLTIMAHGMGAPSAVIVLEELCDLGLEVAVRVGSCGAVADGITPGEILNVESALPLDGVSRDLGCEEVARPDGELAGLLAGGCDRSGLFVTADLFYEHGPGRIEEWRRAGVMAVEMEAAALFAVASIRGIRIACACMVTDGSPGGGERLEGVGLERATERLGRVGLDALLGVGA